jgi:hypothetical protein
MRSAFRKHKFNILQDALNLMSRNIFRICEIFEEMKSFHFEAVIGNKLC